MSAQKHRILVISHGHPDFDLGGGELAAYNLFKSYQTHPAVAAAFFLARHESGKGPTGAIFPRRANEFLWEQGVGDWFRMKHANLRGTAHHFAELLRRLRPSVVHVHHYVSHPGR